MARRVRRAVPPWRPGCRGLDARVDAVVVVQPPHDADLIEQPGLAPRRGRILMSVHAVFPYGGARAPLHNHLPRQGLSPLAEVAAAT